MKSSWSPSCFSLSSLFGVLSYQIKPMLTTAMYSSSYVCLSILNLSTSFDFTNSRMVPLMLNFGRVEGQGRRTEGSVKNLSCIWLQLTGKLNQKVCLFTKTVQHHWVVNKSFSKLKNSNKERRIRHARLRNLNNAYLIPQEDTIL